MKVLTYKQTLLKILPLGVAVALLLVGLWTRWPTVEYDGPPDPDTFARFVGDRFAYSDIALLYFRDHLDRHPVPYLDYPFEYPVGTGLLVYIFSLATNTMPEYFLLTTLAMAACALGIAVLVPGFPRGRVWLFALSPALALYVNLNWDMWGVLLMVAALLLFVRERDGWGAVVLAAAVWAKFFPVLFLPFVVFDRLLYQGRRAAARIVVVFTAVSVVINLPVLLLAPDGWWHFFAFNAQRGGDLTFWSLFDSALLSTDEINRLIALLLLWSLAVLLLVQRRSLPMAWLPACCALLAWFFFIDKVYSPQYGLWIVALLAIIGASSALAVAWSAVDLAYFATSFVNMGLAQFGEAQGWFVEHTLHPSAILREGMLLLVIGWCVKQMYTPAQDPTQDGVKRSQDSLDGVA